MMTTRKRSRVVLLLLLLVLLQQTCHCFTKISIIPSSSLMNNNNRKLNDNNNNNAHNGRRKRRSSSSPSQHKFILHTMLDENNNNADESLLSSSDSSSSRVDLLLRREEEEGKKEAKLYDLQVVLIDHYDSYTYNLYDMLAKCTTKPPIVLSSKELTLEEFREYDCDAIIFSPGPGRPSCSNDMGCTLDIIRDQLSLTSTPKKVPILGVCLGHQALAQVYGGTVSECDPAVHGQVHEIELVRKSVLWNGLPTTTMNVTRYHSLAVEPNSLPDCLQVTATYDNKVIMAFEHKTKPHYGVQFHPESIGTPDGMQLLSNFLEVCQNQKKKQTTTTTTNSRRSSTTTNKVVRNTVHRKEEEVKNEKVMKKTTGIKSVAAPRTNNNNNASEEEEQKTQSEQLVLDPHQAYNYNHNAESKKSGGKKKKKKQYSSTKKKISNLDNLTTTQVFEALYGTIPHSVWLDTSSSLQTKREFTRGRYSIMGGMTGPISKLIQYYGTEHHHEEHGLYVTNIDNHQTKWDGDGGILEYLREEFSITKDDDDEDIPFCGGYLGYLGYEVRHDTQRLLEQQQQQQQQQLQHTTANNNNDNQEEIIKEPSIIDTAANGMETNTAANNSSSMNDDTVPTAVFIFCDQSLVYDHWKNIWYLIEIKEKDDKETTITTTTTWMETTEHILRQLNKKKKKKKTTSLEHKKKTASSFQLRRSRSVYKQDIDDCHEYIRRGESYELCVTNQLQTFIPNDDDDNKRNPLTLYKLLRNQNPAPFSAFMKIHTTTQQQFSICCSSPERFLSVQKSGELFTVEAKPIKGTAARVPLDETEDQRMALELQQSIKNRAENLMIVDLLRNDLSRVCETGTVHVPKLMAIESYATVHQMVSTIRGMTTLSPLDVITACFPGGSMTGAPKRRTMELLHDLERHQNRGPYSGCLGYISVDGQMDMNIIIRSAILTQKEEEGWNVRIGAGGAITGLSESEDEYEEMLLKARAVKEAVEQWGGLVITEEERGRRRD